MSLRALALLPLLLLSAPAHSLQVPELTGPVVDDAHVLPPNEIAALGSMIRKLYDSGQAQMTILTVPDLQGEDIDSFAVEIFEKWKLGSKGKDRGLLLVVSPNDHHMRFEVGYGLEGELTDLFCKRILSDRVAPYFRQNRYGDGLMVAVEAIARKLGVDITANVAEAPVQSPVRHGIRIFFLLLLFFLFVLLMGGPRNRWGGGGFGGGWGGGSWGGGGDGGGWSGGGGGSGGGGASSGW